MRSQDSRQGTMRLAVGSAARPLVATSRQQGRGSDASVTLGVTGTGCCTRGRLCRPVTSPGRTAAGPGSPWRRSSSTKNAPGARSCPTASAGYPAPYSSSMLIENSAPTARLARPCWTARSLIWAVPSREATDLAAASTLARRERQRATPGRDLDRPVSPVQPVLSCRPETDRAAPVPSQPKPAVAGHAAPACRSADPAGIAPGADGFRTR